MGDFPSGQRGQTVNLLSLTSVVRIHHPPPKNPSLTTWIFLSKPQAWHIITARSVVYIISPFGAVSHHAPACILLRLDDIQHFVLMIYRNKLRMIYKAFALIYLRERGIMILPINKNLMKGFLGK